jgi:hypothetical protein
VNLKKFIDGIVYYSEMEMWYFEGIDNYFLLSIPFLLKFFIAHETYRRNMKVLD